MLSEEIQELFQKMNNTGENIGGVYLAKPTGEVLEEDQTLIEVMINELSYYAKPCMAFGSWVVPNKDWLQKYKDEVLVWVAFENGNPAHPVYLGVCPLDDKAPTRPLMAQGKTCEFQWYFDDEKKEYRLSRIDNGQGVKIGEKTILGNGTGPATAVKAEQLEAFLSKLLNLIATGTTPNGPLSTAGAIGAMASEIKTIYSASVKLD